MSDTLLGFLIATVGCIGTGVGVFLGKSWKKPNGDKNGDRKDMFQCKYNSKVEAMMEEIKSTVLNINDRAQRTHENVHKAAEINLEMAKSQALMHQSLERVLQVQDQMMKTFVEFCAKLGG